MLCKNKVLHLYQRKELIITTTKLIKDMKTKEQVIEFVATELKNGNSVVMATLGNGGNGLTLLQGDCSEYGGDNIICRKIKRKSTQYKNDYRIWHDYAGDYRTK